jgi:uncharacterized membrane protein YidH (DUF202 family)
MKVTGIVLVIVGILMCVFTSVNFTQEKKVVDLGPLQINKKEHKTVGWPVYAGIAVGVAGIFFIVADSKKSS